MRASLRLRLPHAFVLTAVLAIVSGTDQSQENLSSDACEQSAYRIHLVSRSPLVIYITDFLTKSERQHLRDKTEGTFSHSGVHAPSGGKTFNKVRTSQSTYVPRDDVVRCVEDRALQFQGFDVPRTHLEPLQLVKYGLGEHYHFHTDWYPKTTHSTAELGGNRVSSFFAYLHVANDTTGGGTNFPLIDAPRDKRWCDLGYIDCDEPWENGITFRPLEGNAIFWQNLNPDGTGDPRLMHAGLPVTSGGKIGMNIWTRQAPLSEEVRGPDL